MIAVASRELLRDAELLARLADALQDWFAWAQLGSDGGPAPGGSAVLRQRMADLLIEHRVASAVLDEARDVPTAEGDGKLHLVRHCVVRCLRLAAEAIGGSRGEPAVAWMRDELAVRRDGAG